MMRYIGAGRFLNGVPARDMTEAEWSALTPDQREQALAHKLYAPDAPALATRPKPASATGRPAKEEGEA